MHTDRLGDVLMSGKPAIGIYIAEPNMVELAAHLGFDWFMIDLMFTSTDWGKLEYLMRTGEANEITPVVRVQSNPWLGYDHRVAVDVSRILGLGFQYVMVSNSGKREMEECAIVSREWHRRNSVVHPFGDFDEWEPGSAALAKRTHVFPQPETVQALRELQETVSIPEIDSAFIAMTDASKALTGVDRPAAKPDWYTKALWELVDEMVSATKARGGFLGANTSYAYDMREMTRRVERLHEHGVQMIMAQGATFLFQVAIGAFLREVHAAVGR